MASTNLLYRPARLTGTGELKAIESFDGSFGFGRLGEENEGETSRAVRRRIQNHFTISHFSVLTIMWYNEGRKRGEKKRKERNRNRNRKRERKIDFGNVKG